MTCCLTSSALISCPGRHNTRGSAASSTSWPSEGGRSGILWYEQPEDLDGITQLVGTWFQDHIAPRLTGPETAVRGRVVVNTTPPHTTKT